MIRFAMATVAVQSPDGLVSVEKRHLVRILLAFCLVAGLSTQAFAEQEPPKAALDKLGPAILEWLKEKAAFKSSNPLLSEEYRQFEEHFLTEIKNVDSGSDAPLHISIVSTMDVTFGGPAPETLVLFIDPTCEFCTQAFRHIIENNNFKERNLVLKAAPNIRLDVITSSLYALCDIADANDLYARLNITNRALSKEFDKYSYNEKIDALATRFNLSIPTLNECRTLEKARHQLSNRLDLHRQCPRIGCDFGYVQVTVRGAVVEALVPPTPAWFLGRISNQKGSRFELFIEKAGVGLDSLMRVVPKK